MVLTTSAGRQGPTVVMTMTPSVADPSQHTHLDFGPCARPGDGELICGPRGLIGPLTQLVLKRALCGPLVFSEPLGQREAGDRGGPDHDEQHNERRAALFAAAGGT